MRRKLFLILTALAATGIFGTAKTQSNFKMLLRLWPHHHTNDSLKAELLQALKTYPDLWDEAWFCMEITTLDKNKHTRSAQKMARAAAELRKIGIGTSIQGITLGHGDSFEFSSSELKPKEWSTIVNNAGEATQMGNCPRQEAFLTYIEQTYGAYAAACKPVAVWLDDDLRITNHWPARMLCFCDTCIGLFNRENGFHYDRVALVEALESNAGDGNVRSKWIRFCQESLALVAQRAARGIHAASPSTTVGLQHANFHRELLEGYDWQPIFNAMRQETGMAPVSRPGNGFYDDHEPRGMIQKALDMARQIRRLPPDVQQIAAEVEGFPHRATAKSPHGLCVESQLYLAMGVTQLSYAIICSAVEPMEWYADNYFKHLSRWRAFYERFTLFNEGTEPGGLNPYISRNCVWRQKENGEPPFAWITTNANDGIERIATLGMPFTPDGHFPTALFMDAGTVRGLGEAEGRELFESKSILLDKGAWDYACKRGFDRALHPVASPISTVSCYQSDKGARIAVVASYNTEISNAERLLLLEAADWCSGRKLPVISENTPQMMVIPRVYPDGQLRSVTLLNCTISECEDIRLKLRGCRPGKKCVWRNANEKDKTLKQVRNGEDVIVTIPRLESWDAGYIAIV